jgi:hypothetical protein
VVYNTMTSGETQIMSPPIGFNLAVGSVGSIRSDSTLSSFVSLQAQVSPRSMFAQQLADRIGQPQADRIMAPAARRRSRNITLDG